MKRQLTKIETDITSCRGNLGRRVLQNIVKGIAIALSIPVLINIAQGNQHASPKGYIRKCIL